MRLRATTVARAPVRGGSTKYVPTARAGTTTSPVRKSGDRLEGRRGFTLGRRVGAAAGAMSADGPPAMQTPFTKTLGIKCESSVAFVGLACRGAVLPAHRSGPVC